MEIPYDQLSRTALIGIIEEFVLREGTDYGPKEYSLEEKVSVVQRQLERGEAKVVYNPDDQSCDIVRGKSSV